MNDGKVKVSLNQAVEFAAQGFEIECYVLPGKPQPTRQAHKCRRIGRNTLVTLSLEGKPPQNGQLGRVWERVKKNFWGRDITKRVKYGDLMDAITEHGGNRNASSQLLRKYKVIREVEDASTQS